MPSTSKACIQRFLSRLPPSLSSRLYSPPSHSLDESETLPSGFLRTLEPPAPFTRWTSLLIPPDSIPSGLEGWEVGHSTKGPPELTCTDVLVIFKHSGMCVSWLLKDAGVLEISAWATEQ